MEEVYGVFGAGGYGREVMPIARSQLLKLEKSVEFLFFVVDVPQAEKVNGVKVVSLTEFLQLDTKRKYLTCAISDSQARLSLKQRIREFEIIEWTVIAENSLIMDNVKVGQGSILSPFVTITSNVTIGSNFHANIYSYVAHDCIIGDFVTFAPGVKCNGNVVIEDHAYIGTGAIIKPGKAGAPLRIGRGAVVGMGSVVTKDVPAGVTVVGNPAKIFKP